MACFVFASFFDCVLHRGQLNSLICFCCELQYNFSGNVKKAQPLQRRIVTSGSSTFNSLFRYLWEFFW